MTSDVIRPEGQSIALRLLTLAATAFSIHYYVLHEVLGLLAVDEVYFAHVFWLIQRGHTLYTDFFENHWPVYVYLVAPILPEGGKFDLTYVWWLRAMSLMAAFAYVIMLRTIARRDFLFLLPFLFLFLTFGRMTEIRPDIFGLLLFNIGWWLLLRDPNRIHILAAALLAAASLSFSARAAIMAVGLAALFAYLCVKRRDWRLLWMLSAFGGILVAAAIVAYLLNPQRIWQMVSLIYLEPGGITPSQSVWQRLLPIDRLLMVVLICIALAAALWRKADKRSPVILFACATQLILILVDPSPYQYVYSWAAIPVLAGLSLLGDGRASRLHSALTIAASLLAAITVILSFSGPTPRPGSALRVTYDPPFAGELRQKSTAELIRLATTSQRQQGLWNQLALFGEICRRIDSPVLTKFYANLICLPDASYDWPGLKWPPIFEDDVSTASRAEFERLFATHPPVLVAWGKQHYVPRLNPWGRALLADYDTYEGYAIKRQR